MLADVDGAALGNRSSEYELANAVFDITLQRPLQRTGSELNVVALGGNKRLGLFVELNRVAQFGDSFQQGLQLYVDDAFDGVEVELVEGDDLVG